MESAANRYTFVWKKSVLKNQKELLEKIRAEFALSPQTKPDAVVLTLNEAYRRLIEQAKTVMFVSGRGHRKTEIQRRFERYSSRVERLNAYEEHLRIMGERSSYSKTDPDATFMRMNGISNRSSSRPTMTRQRNENTKKDLAQGEYDLP